MASVMEGDGEGPESGSGSSSAAESGEPREMEIRKNGDNGSVAVIREIYDSENANEIFEAQLEHALTQKVDTIIIEPFKLGDETSRWIAVGNCLHKTAVIAGLGSIISAFAWPDKPFIHVPASLLSGLCTTLYSISWQRDPCCSYQVETSGKRLEHLALGGLNSASPVVLVKKDDSRRKILHTAVTLAAVSQTLLRLYLPYINYYWMDRPRPYTYSPPRVPSDRVMVSELPTMSTLPPPLSATNFMSNVFGGFNKEV